MRALVSVYDKTGILDFCKKLHELEIEIISTGGTGDYLSKNGIPHIPVEQITKNKEAFGGRMKTISFEMISSLLYRRNHPLDESHRLSLGIEPIDMVVCNLYDFNSAVLKNAPLDDLIELIDIGGPTMIRASAKNYKSVSVITDPEDYEMCANELLLHKKLSIELNEKLALKAFSLTSRYDLAIQIELNKRFKNNNVPVMSDSEKILRYGENHHQSAKLSIFNLTNAQHTLANSPILQGREISYNNYLDSDFAYKCVSELKIINPSFCSVVIVKHGTPCGIASAKNLFEAMKAAWDCDSISAFGGIIAISEPMTLEVAQFITENFVEVVIAPSFNEESREVFNSKKNIRLIEAPLKNKKEKEVMIRSINGGLLIQDEDELTALDSDFEIKTKKGFEEINRELLVFGQTVIKYLKSNCLALVRNDNDIFKITSSGVGQPNRLHCLSLLIKEKTKGIDLSKDILFSDAFFPFADSIMAAHELGIKYIVQPGGSIKDKEVINACNELNISMCFSHSRHFRH